MALSPFLNPVKNKYSLTVSKTSPFKGTTRSLREFSKGLREKLQKRPVVNFQTDGHFMYVTQSCVDIEELFLGIDEGVQKLIDMLQKMKVSNAKTISTISGTVEFLTDNSLKIMQKGIRNLELLGQLESATDFSSGASFIDEIENASDDIENDVKAVRHVLQQYDEEVGKGFIVKEFIEKKLWLQNVEKAIKAVTDENSPVKITMDELRVLCGCLRESVQGRKIFVVVNIKEGKRKASQVEVISENQICFSHLEEKELPPKSFFIKFDSLTYTSRRAFLDLAFEGTFLSRVVIALKNEGLLPLYFLHMCAGDLGPGYASYGYFEIPSTENIVMRQDEKQVREMTKKSVFFGVDWKKELRRDIYNYKLRKEGDLCCFMSGRTRNESGRTLTFRILTSRNRERRLRIGSVMTGLNNLKHGLSKYPELREGDVTDCGLVVTF